MKQYPVNKIQKIFRLDRLPKSIYRDAELGIIPIPSRIQRGATSTRMWPASDLPGLGAQYGFLDTKKINGCKVLVVYFDKGGVGKTTTALNFARIFAINNIRTIYIELDKQRSGSSFFSNVKDNDVGLYDVSMGKASIDQIIRKTDLPTLDYIPATTNLLDLEYKIQTTVRRELVLSRILEQLKQQYQIIIIDNQSNFGQIVQNALAFATHLIIPLQCEAICHQSVMDNIKPILQYRSDIDATWNNIYISTMVDTDNQSKFIDADYKKIFGAEICQQSIRSSVIAGEAYIEQQSILEYAPSSPLADDYYNVICDVFGRITG